MIDWTKLTVEQQRYALWNADNPLAVFIGVPEARAAAERKLGKPSTWPVGGG